MKKILMGIIPLILSLLALIILWNTFSIPHQAYYDGTDSYPDSGHHARRDLQWI
jgi:hypothetical protein